MESIQYLENLIKSVVGQTGMEVLNVIEGSVVLFDNLNTNTYSIGLITDKGIQCKPISQNLYNMLYKELIK